MTRAQQLPRAVHLPGAASLCRRTASSSSRRSPTSTCWPTPSCARPANRSAPSRWKARSTSWPHAMEHRPDRAAAPQRAREGSDHRARPSRRATWSRPMRDGAERFGWDKRDRDAGPPARGRVADRHGRRHRDLSLLPHARRRGADHARRRRPRHGVDVAAHEMGMGTATVQTQHRRRPARPAARAGDVRVRRHARCRRACWPAARQQTASIGAAVMAAAARRCVAELLKLAGNDSPARRAEGRARSERATAGSRKLDEPDRARELRLDPGARQARRASRPRQPRRCRWR